MASRHLRSQFDGLFLAALLISLAAATGNCAGDAKDRPDNKRVAVHPLYDDLARYIAGMPASATGGLDPSLRQRAEWKRYAAAMDQEWRNYQRERLDTIEKWRDTELASITNTTSPRTLFYPFGGPDILHARVLFPNCRRYVLIGLEPPGTPPALADCTEDSARRYFERMDAALFHVLNISFFRTYSLAEDLNADRNASAAQLDGTLHLLLFFLARTGNSITNVRAVAIDESGKRIRYSTFADRDTAARNPGLDIRFIDSTGARKQLYYFSVNLSDHVLAKNNGFLQYAKSLGPLTTYLKSASYLMHYSNFSIIRRIVLGQSVAILQDDSGIPLKFFDSATWNVQLFGTYRAPIKLFANMFQEDLRAAYDDRSQVKPLPFGIGYHHRVGQSNLLLARKK